MPKMKRFALALLLTSSVPLLAGEVKIHKTPTGWGLTVNGRPFFIKGVGCNQEEYLLLAKEMGANSVRTWGVPTQQYLDQSHKYGLMVNAGVWFNPIRMTITERYTDPSFVKKRKAEVLETIKELKDHPALLFWNLGNEVFAFTESEEEKIAFGHFLEDLIQAVHKEDPDHPVVYASAWKTDLPYLKKYVPSLDIVGINTYGQYRPIRQWVTENKYARPIIATEYGPKGDWDVPNDINQIPYDPYDHNKTSNYVTLWNEIKNTEGSFGGYAFVIGEQRNQGSVTWWNLHYGNKKRHSFWGLYKQYTNQEPENWPPKIRLMKLAPAKNLKPGQPVNVKVTVSDPEDDPLTFSYFTSDIDLDPIFMTSANYIRTRVKADKPGQATVDAPDQEGTFRIYVAVEDDSGNIAIASRSITVKE